MRKILFWVLIGSICSLAGLTLEGKNKNDFQCKASIPAGKDIFTCGEDISFKVSLQYPANYKICAWSLYAYEKNLPENFAKVTKRKVNGVKNPKWSSVSLQKVIWLPTAMRTKKDLNLQFGTKDFPPGDYNVTVSCVFQGKNKQGKSQTIYRAASLGFSLEVRK